MATEPELLSTDLKSGWPTPRFLPPVVGAAVAQARASEVPRAPASPSSYCPGQLLRQSALMDMDVVDPTALPRLLGRRRLQVAANSDLRKGPVLLDLLPVEEAAAEQSAVVAEELSREEAAAAAVVAVPWKLGSPEWPTVGSGSHHLGTCKPCAFVHTSGCQSGVLCSFCHLCEKGEKKFRKKEKRELRRMGLHPRRGACDWLQRAVLPPLPPTAVALANLVAPAAAEAAAGKTTLAAMGARRAAAIIAASSGGDV